MSTELESFEQFLRAKLANGEVDGTPEKVVQDWRGNVERRQSFTANAGRSETLFDRLSRKGLLGTVLGGPADLSTNPQYMEGFGES